MARIVSLEFSMFVYVSTSFSFFNIYIYIFIFILYIIDIYIYDIYTHSLGFANTFLQWANLFMLMQGTQPEP